MDVLESVINNLTSDEVRRFKILSNRFKAEDEKKLLILFDAIRSGKFEEEDDGLVEALYGDSSAPVRNRYYRLRNKLLDNIEKSLVFYHFKYKDSIHAYYDIQLSIMFRERGNYELAHYFLRKAEKKATELDQFNILELIFEEYVQLAIKDISLDIESILERRVSNLEKIRIHRENTEAMAVITQQLKKSNFSRQKDSVVGMLDEIRDRIEASAGIFNSAEGRILIFRTVSTLLLQKRAFGQMVEYLEKTIADFENEKLFNNDNHATRLLMRLWLINAYYKTYRFDDALEGMAILEREMKLYNRQNYTTYLFNYYNVKVNILKCLGQAREAEELIHEALKQKGIGNEQANEVFLLISLADQQFNTGNFSAAIQSIKQVKARPEFYNLDEEMRMFLDIFEMVNHFEKGDTSFMDEQMKNFRKEYRKLLKAPEQDRTNRFIEILERMNTAKIENKRVSLKSAFKGFQQHFSKHEQGDNEIIQYDLYLQSLLKERPYYEIFVEEMKARNHK